MANLRCQLCKAEAREGDTFVYKAITVIEYVCGNPHKALRILAVHMECSRQYDVSPLGQGVAKRNKQ